jgi:hypothetical protein
MRRAWVLPVCTALAFAVGARASASAAPAPESSQADSVTLGLWHFDERSGPRVHDSGPFRLNGVAGPDTRVEFGRFKSARSFAGTAQSFVVVPYNAEMESPRAFTVEAWVYLNDLSAHELSAIAMRWSSSPNEQSWVLGVVGQKRAAATPSTSSWFSQVVAPFNSGRLVFAYKGDVASAVQRAASTATLPMKRWVHVAATVDGQVVRIYVDGRLDAQVAVANGIRRSQAALVFGNAVDTRRLTDVHGDLRQGSGGAPPWYALNGLVDELRLSKVARKTFESTDAR